MVDFGDIGAWLPIVSLVITISFIITTLFYTISLAFNLNNLKMWAKSEYMQLIATVLIVAFFVAAFNVTETIVIGAVTNMGEAMSYPGGFTCEGTYATMHLGQHFCAALNQIDAMMGCMKSLYNDIFWVNSFIEPIEKMYTEVASSEGMGGWPFSGAVSIMKMMAQYINFSVLMMYLQKNFLLLASQTMMTMVLPAGIILRAFPMTRGAGGFLMAAAIGFYFVMPISYIVTLAIFGKVNSDCEIQVPAAFAGEDENCHVSRVDLMQDKSFVAMVFEQGDINSWLEKIENNWARRLHALFLPLIVLTITFTFIRSTASLFGADVMEFSRGLVKLI